MSEGDTSPWPADHDPQAAAEWEAMGRVFDVRLRTHRQEAVFFVLDTLWPPPDSPDYEDDSKDTLADLESLGVKLAEIDEAFETRRLCDEARRLAG